MSDHESIDITPKGMKTPEGCKRVNEAIDRKQKADAQCATLLKELWGMIGSGAAFESFLQEYTADREWTEEMLESVDSAIKELDEAVDEMLRSIAGLPKV